MSVGRAVVLGVCWIRKHRIERPVPEGFLLGGLRPICLLWSGDVYLNRYVYIDMTVFKAVRRGYRIIRNYKPIGGAAFAPLSFL